MKNTKYFFISGLICLFISDGVIAQKRPPKPKPTITKNFNSKARPKSITRDGKTRLQIHNKPKPTLGPSSSLVKTKKSKQNIPKTNTNRSLKGKFNSAIAPRLKNKFNTNSLRGTTNMPKRKSPPSIKKSFNAASKG